MTTVPWLHALTSPTHDLPSNLAPYRVLTACASRFVSHELASALVESCRIWARAAMLAGDAAVGAEPSLRGHDALAAQACQLDALMRLATLVCTQALWSQLEVLLTTTIEALAVEVACHDGRRDPAAMDVDAAIAHARARDAVTGAWVYAVAAAAPAFDARSASAAHGHLVLALRAMHDAANWRLDAALARPSLVLAGIAPSGELARALVAGGRLYRTYELALAELALAQERGADLLGVPFSALIADLERRARAARDALPIARA